jgi:hypothetical protein
LTTRPSELALFLAGAVLRSELTESGIVRRLRLLGFESAEPMNEPEFPIDSLTLLAFGVFSLSRRPFNLLRSSASRPRA